MILYGYNLDGTRNKTALRALPIFKKNSFRRNLTKAEQCAKDQIKKAHNRVDKFKSRKRKDNEPDSYIQLVSLACSSKISRPLAGPGQCSYCQPCPDFLPCHARQPSPAHLSNNITYHHLLSKYLQTTNADLLTASIMIQTATKKLISIQHFNGVLEETDEELERTLTKDS